MPIRRTGSGIMLLLCAAGTLYGQAASGSKQTTPVPGLSHAMVAVDSPTYAAILASRFLREELGALEVRTTAREGGRSYSGAYLYGRETYLEIQVSPGGASDGLGQLYLGTDVEGDLHRVIDNLLTSGGGPVTYGMANRFRGAQAVPWFYSARILPPPYGVVGAVGGAESRFRLFLLEWHPQFLRGWFDNIPAESVSVSRAANLAPQWKADRYLRDIVGITYALDEDEIAAAANRLTILGYKVTTRQDTTTAIAPELTVKLVPATRVHHGLVALHLTLERIKEGERIYRFGPRSELRFGNERDATWVF
jgi:hypothetical protein